MQFKYLGELNLKGLSQKILDQQEYWALNAILNFAKNDLDKAAELFGCPINLFLERLEKHGLIQSGDELLSGLLSNS